MQFVKFGEEYVAASSILRVVFRTDKETQASGSDPYLHSPQPKDMNIAVALVMVEGRNSDLQVSGEAALKALRSFCDREVIPIF
jgi:hypothetical protein